MMIDGARPRRELAVISNYPLEGYLLKGYDYLITYGYYNAFGFFDRVHFFEPPLRITLRSLLRNRLLLQARITRLLTGQDVLRSTPIMGRTYSLCIHQTLDYSAVKQVFLAHKIDCIRVYEMFSFALAAQLSDEFSIPLVASIH